MILTYVAQVPEQAKAVLDVIVLCATNPDDSQCTYVYRSKYAYTHYYNRYIYMCF